MKWFPSPAGSSYFSMAIKFLLNRKLDRFPSPAGSSYFSIIKPLLGTVLWSFRPLRGLRISQSSIRRRSPKTSSFPSPAGSSYFSIGDAELKRCRFENEFPSPAGSSYFSIKTQQTNRKSAILFPSPAGSSYFSIFMTVCIEHA